MRYFLTADIIRQFRDVVGGEKVNWRGEEGDEETDRKRERENPRITKLILTLIILRT